jgi:hypothetical protein
MKNHRVAAAGVELIAPTSNVGRKKPLSEFHLDAAGDVTAALRLHLQVLQIQKERETQRRI